jgi:hypothetical protein
VLQVSHPEGVSHGRRSHGHARMAGFCFLYGINGKKPDGIDTSVFKILLISHCVSPLVTKIFVTSAFSQ